MSYFSLIDKDAPLEVHNSVREVLNTGASLLLPPLVERVEFLHLYLSNGKNLSMGQQMLLGIILHSLEEPVLTAALLGYSSSPEKLKLQEVQLTSTLMNTLLHCFCKNSVSIYLQIINYYYNYTRHTLILGIDRYTISNQHR